jgi:hypothetical protein
MIIKCFEISCLEHPLPSIGDFEHDVGSFNMNDRGTYAISIVVSIGFVLVAPAIFIIVSVVSALRKYE